MAAIRLSRCIISDAEFNRRIIVRIRPTAGVGNHFPPNTHVFYRMNPGRIVISTRIIQIQDKAARQHLGSRVCNLNSTPGRMTRGLHIAFPSLRIRCQERSQCMCFLIHIQVHARIIHQCSFVNADIQAGIRPHQQRGLNTAHREQRLGRVPAHGSLQVLADF